jgi:hypothetical protein
MSGLTTAGCADLLASRHVPDYDDSMRIVHFSRPTGDSCTVWRECYRIHLGRIPPQRAFLAQAPTRALIIDLINTIFIACTDAVALHLRGQTFETAHRQCGCEESMKRQSRAINVTTISRHATQLLARRCIPNLHGFVMRPADDVLAVRRLPHRAHAI